MNKLEYGWYRSFKRHSEALIIIAFVLFDCLASGWVLNVGASIAVLYVWLPAVRTLWALSPVERPTFIKAFAKTHKVQKLAILLFWVYLIRFLVAATSNAALFTLKGPKGELPSVSNALLLGARELGPLAFLMAPIFIYLAACFAAILWRTRLKATKQDPDLVEQRQRWSGLSHVLFVGAFISSILSITVNEKGPGYMISNWLLASARDANIYGFDEVGAPVGMADSGPAAPFLFSADPTGMFSDFSFVHSFDVFVLTALTLVLFFLLLKPAARFHAFLNSFCWRVVKPESLQNIIESFLEALRLKSRVLSFREAHLFANNALRTLVWIVVCYVALFWLFGFCGGPLGLAIQNWMMASAIDAGFGPANDAPKFLFEAPFRIFLGSIVALYGTAPIAVTACVFLPFSSPRKIFLNCDGISFGQGPYFCLWGRQFRLWSDLKSVTVKVKSPSRENAGSSSQEALNAEFALQFRSGGRVTFKGSQFSSRDLQVLLDSIDQYAASCAVDSEVYRLCEQMRQIDHDSAATDGIADTTIASIPANEFKSTIFVPLEGGDLLPGTKTRIIKLLSSKPLCAVYLARTEDGRMVTVKQFYLANETDETRALEKILKREYELLSALDHPGIAKVIHSCTFEKSTFLVIEHRLGSDLRAVVTEHGARSESLTIAWAKQLCDIMIYLHSCQPTILHRDLTPDNIIVGEDGNLRLIDFGAAREFLEGITGTMLGKHSYVSPEQLRGDATVRSDIYSFGGTLCYLLTGRDPVALSQSCPGKSTDCSAELDQLVRDCTEFDEGNRPQSFEEILERLNHMDSGFKLKLSSSAKEKAPV